jgi:integrase
MRLTNAVDQIATECDLAKSTISQYRRAASRFSEFVGYQADSTDLTGPKLNEFITFLQLKLSNTSASNYRRALCRIWNFLTQEEGKPSYEIRRLRRPKTVEKPVVAWSLRDLQLLISSCEQFADRRLKCGIVAQDYFRALLLTAYDTGLRPSDLFVIRWEQFDGVNRCIVLVQNKTKKPHIVFLADETVAAINKIRGQRDAIFPLTWGGVRKWMERLFAIAAPLGFVRTARQNLGTLRKTNATQTYIADGESAAAESLGHTSGTRIVRKHYIDHRARRQYSIPKRPDC